MLLVLLVLFANSCTAATGYRLSAGPTIDTDGGIAATVRLGGHIGFLDEKPRRPKRSIGMEMTAEAVGSTRGDLGGGIGVDFVRLGTFAGRLGLRSEVTRNDGNGLGSMSIATGIAHRVKQRRGEVLLGAEFRAGALFSDQVDHASSRFFLGVSLERNRYRYIRGPRLGK